MVSRILVTVRRHAILGTALGSVLATPVYAQAQQAGASAEKTAPADELSEIQLTEIIVTAQKREENMQVVPIAVSAISAETIASSGISNSKDLAQIVPGLNILSTIGVIQPHLRGIGQISAAPGIESPIATYVDGVYYASAPGSQLVLTNIASLEVYKGPQGTLFGRNATGGVINVTTVDPGSTPRMDVSVGYGNYRTATANAYLEGGLAPDLNAGVVGYYSDQGEGYGVNLANGQEARKGREWATRGKLVWTRGSDTKVTMSGDYSGYDSDIPSSLRPAPGTKPASRGYRKGHR